MSRFMAAVFAATLASMLATNAGLPWWRDHPAGDASDLAICTFFLVWFTLGALAPTGASTKEAA